RPQRKIRLGVEALDRRDMPSVTASFSSATGSLAISGDDAANQIAITEIAVSNTSGYYLLSGVSSVSWDGRPAGNTISTSLVRSLSVFLGGGGDTFALQRAFTVNGLPNATLNYLQRVYIEADSSTAGNDLIDLSASTTPAYVIGGAGNDTIR